MIEANRIDDSVALSRIESSQPAPALPWKRLYDDPAFAALLARKARFVVPAVAFFIAYYFALPVLVGYAPALMERKVFGHINLAYLFALSQFGMGWLLMGLYVARARGFDADAQALKKAASRMKGAL